MGEADAGAGGGGGSLPVTARTFRVVPAILLREGDWVRPEPGGDAVRLGPVAWVPDHPSVPVESVEAFVDGELQVWAPDERVEVVQAPEVRDDLPT